MDRAKKLREKSRVWRMLKENHCEMKFSFRYPARFLPMVYGQAVKNFCKDEIGLIVTVTMDYMEGKIIVKIKAASTIRLIRASSKILAFMVLAEYGCVMVKLHEDDSAVGGRQREGKYRDFDVAYCEAKQDFYLELKGDESNLVIYYEQFYERYGES